MAAFYKKCSAGGSSRSQGLFVCGDSYWMTAGARIGLTFPSTTTCNAFVSAALQFMDCAWNVPAHSECCQTFLQLRGTCARAHVHARHSCTATLPGKLSTLTLLRQQQLLMHSYKKKLCPQLLG